MTNRYSNKDINTALTELRNQLRDGRTTLYFRSEGSAALRKVIAGLLGIDPDAFNSENFKPQTLKRWAALFDVPRFPVTGHWKLSTWRYPSQDDTAWAIQNFINRRAKPWEFLKPTSEQFVESNTVNSL